MPKNAKFVPFFDNRWIISMKIVFCASIGARTKSVSQTGPVLKISAIFAKNAKKWSNFDFSLHSSSHFSIKVLCCASNDTSILSHTGKYTSKNTGKQSWEYSEILYMEHFRAARIKTPYPWHAKGEFISQDIASTLYKGPFKNDVTAKMTIFGPPSLPCH